jgi:hypothetical protein
MFEPLRLWCDLILKKNLNIFFQMLLLMSWNQCERVLKREGIIIAFLVFSSLLLLNPFVVADFTEDKAVCYEECDKACGQKKYDYCRKYEYSGCALDVFCDCNKCDFLYDSKWSPEDGYDACAAGPIGKYETCITTCQSDRESGNDVSTCWNDCNAELNDGLLPCKDEQCATYCITQGYENGKWTYYTSSGGYDTCSCEGVKSTSTTSSTPQTTTLTTSISDVEPEINPEPFPDEEVEEEPEAPDPELFPEENNEEITSTEIDPSYFPEEGDGLDEALSSGVAEEFVANEYIVTAGDSMSFWDFFTRKHWEEAWEGAKRLRELYPGDGPFTGEDGTWLWRTKFTDPENGDEVDVKLIGADAQFFTNDAFKVQIYLYDLNLPGSKFVDGSSFGAGFTADWKGKFKFSLGIPTLPIDLTIVPRDYLDGFVGGIRHYFVDEPSRLWTKWTKGKLGPKGLIRE